MISRLATEHHIRFHNRRNEEVKRNEGTDYITRKKVRKTKKRLRKYIRNKGARKRKETKKLEDNEIKWPEREIKKDKTVKEYRVALSRSATEHHKTIFITEETKY